MVALVVVVVILVVVFVVGLVVEMVVVALVVVVDFIELPDDGTAVFLIAFGKSGRSADSFVV